MDDVNYDALIALLPPEARKWLTLFVQLVAVLSFVLPLIERAIKKVKPDADMRVLDGLQKVLSMFPRVQVPALSQRPPVPPSELKRVEVSKWPELPPTPPKDS